MSVQPMGGWFDFIGDTWNNIFDSGSSGGDTGTPYVTNPTLNADPFGFELNLSSFTNPDSNPYLPAYNEFGYLGTTGVTADTTTTSGGGFDFNFDSILSGITDSVSALGSVFGTGLQAYADVQKLITSLAPQDKIVVRNGTTYVDRTVNGQTTTLPASVVYPQFVTQFQKAEKETNDSKLTQTLILAGVLGLGLVLILKKK